MCTACACGTADSVSAQVETSGGTVYTVGGMTCGHCVSSVSAEIGKVGGVTGVQVDLAGGAVTVSGAGLLRRGDPRGGGSGGLRPGRDLARQRFLEELHPSKQMVGVHWRARPPGGGPTSTSHPTPYDASCHPGGDARNQECGMNAVNPRRWQALIVLATAQFMVIMDTSIIGVALPDMQADSASPRTTCPGSSTPTSIAFGGLLLLGGRLSDLLGARRVFTAGWVVLVAGSLVAGAGRHRRRRDHRPRRPGRRRGADRPVRADPADDALRRRRRSELGKAMALYGAAAPAGGTAACSSAACITEYAELAVGVLRQHPDRPGRPAPPSRPCCPPVAGRARLDRRARRARRHRRASPPPSTPSSAPPRWAGARPRRCSRSPAAAVLLGAFVVIQATRREPLMPLGIWRTPEPGRRQRRAWRCSAPPGSRCGSSSTSTCSRCSATAPSPAARRCCR